MGCRPAPAVAKALKEATERWPDRDISSDGACADERHKGLVSDHNPDADGYATAFDVDHDPDNGFDAALWAERLRERKDPRVKYVIFRGRMFASYDKPHRKAWEWGPYTGDNAHLKHMHVSVLPERKHDTAPWWADAPQEDDVPQPTDKVDALITPDGGGVWVLQRDGGIITHGNARFFGAYPGLPEKDRQGDRYFVALHPFKGGYVQVASDGATYHFPAR